VFDRSEAILAGGFQCIERGDDMRARKLEKVGSTREYDFYKSAADDSFDCGAIYNIVPSGSKAPDGGYRRRQYIEEVKGVKFPAEVV
jgi:hypothetical protein